MSSSNVLAPSPASSGPSLRVLLVEDDPGTRETTVEMLRMLGHWTASVSSAEAARDRYIDGAFDVLMCDVGLPGLSGLDLVQSLQPRGVGLLLVSGGRRPAVLPADCAWLGKPYGLDALAQVLERLRPPARPAARAQPELPATPQPRVGEGGTGASSMTAGAAGGAAGAAAGAASGPAGSTGTPGARWPGRAWGTGAVLAAGGT